ncbi:MAG: FeoA family protein, partial [Kiritimatiellia bacterium]
MRAWFRRCCGRRRPVDNLSGVLSQCPTGSRVVITGNAQLASVELGLYSGAVVEMLQNDACNHLLVVQAGDARLSVPRKWAAAIYVASLDRAGRHAGPWHLLREVRSYLRINGRVDTRS